MRFAFFTLALLASGLGSIGELKAADARSTCRPITPDTAISINGKIWRETPDITAPALRHINSLLSARCFDAAQAEMQSWQSSHPEDYQIAFMQARLLWIFNQADAANNVLDTVLELQPDFASARVLAAGLALQENDLPRASEMLNKASAISSNDLWMFIDKLRLRVMQDGRHEPSLSRQVAELMSATQSPPRVRSAAARLIIDWLANTTDAATLEQAYRTEIRDGLDEYRQSNTANFARWLILVPKRTAEARALLEPIISADTPYDDTARVLMAESWLFDAAKVDSVQTQRNVHLVDKARAVLGGTLDPIARDSALTPQLTALQGFFRVIENVDKRDEDGMSGLCAALSAFNINVSLIEEMLENLADPNQTCQEYFTPIGLVLAHGDSETEARLVVLKDLLAKGANPNSMVFSMEASKFCATDKRCDPFLPILQPLWDASAKD